MIITAVGLGLAALAVHEDGKMKTSTMVLLGVGAAVVVTVAAVGIHEEMKSKGSQPAPLQAAVTLTQGHRYNVSLSCPTPISAPALQAGAPAVLVGLPTQTPTGWTFVFDYTGPTTTSPVDPSTMLGQLGCTATVTDMGLSPGPVQGAHNIPPQMLTIAPLQQYKASKVAGGQLLLTGQGIGAMGLSGSSSAVHGNTTSQGPNQLLVTLSGLPGTIKVAFPSLGNPQYTVQQIATIVVS